jgi:hypothetical protein
MLASSYYSVVGLEVLSNILNTSVRMGNLGAIFDAGALYV